MPGALVPPAGSTDRAGEAGKDASLPDGAAGGVAGGVAGAAADPGGIGDVGAGRRFSGAGVVFCCVPGAGVSDPGADATGTAVSAVPDPGDTDEEELWQAIRSARMAQCADMPVFPTPRDLTQLATPTNAARGLSLCYRRLMRGPGLR